MLRENGSVIVPIRKGAHPAMVAEYAGSGPCYLVNPITKYIESVTQENALELINEAPVDLMTCSSADELVTLVKAVLANGGYCENVDPVDWHKWLALFEETENEVMFRFLKNAKEMLTKLQLN
jgi:hypothetical protein